MAVQWVEWLQYVQGAVDNGKQLQEIADYIGCKKTALSQQIKIWRRKGVQIKHMSELSEGTIRQKIIYGIVYRYQKIEGKWKLLGQQEGQQTKRVAARKTREEKKAVRDRYLQMKPKKLVHMKKEEKKLPTKHVDSTNMHYVKVDSKTMIQIPVDKDEKTAIEEWKSRHNQYK